MRQAGAPLCVSESVKVCVRLRVEKARLQIWRALDETAEHPGHRCVELRSAGDSVGQGLSVSSAHHRAQQSHIRGMFCRSYSASLLHSRCNKHQWLPHDYTIHNIHLQVLLSKLSYLHNRAGVASLLAALTDQECSRSFALKHLLSLRPAQLPDKPKSLVLMWQVLLVSFQHICTEKNKQTKELCFNTSTNSVLFLCNELHS